MKIMLILAAAFVLAGMPAYAKSSAAQDSMKTCAATWKSKSDADKKGTDYKTFMSGCLKSGSAAPAPVAAAAPAGGGSMASCAANWKGMSDASKKTTTYKTYMSGCMSKGGSTAMAAPAMTAPKPAPMAMAPAKPGPAATKTASTIPVEGHTGTSARCKDGKVISIKVHSGACSHHGGVAAWL